jgi:hypothetical protein
MKRIIITESQYTRLLTNSQEVDHIEKIRNFTNEEREIFLKILEFKYPKEYNSKKILKESKNISESEWYNVVGDIAGIFDPTGLVDAANAVSYFSQGDVLFGMLSLVSIVPYVGDALAKPVVMGAKLAGNLLKPLRAALKAKNVGKIGEALTKLKGSGSFGKKVVDFFRGFADSSLINGIKKVIKKIETTKIGKSLKKLVDEWVDIFKNASKEIGKKVPKKTSTGNTYYVRDTPTGAARFISKSEAHKLLGKTFVEMLTPLAGSGKAFTTAGKGTRFKGTTALFTGTSPLRKLLNKSKLWGHFLEYAGLGDTRKDVDTVVAKYGEKATGVNFERFINSEDGKQAVKDEFGDIIKDVGTTAVMGKLGL